MSNTINNKNDGSQLIENCAIPFDKEQQYDTLIPRVARGNAPVLIGIICERVHCVLYDYAINTVDMIIDTYGDKVDVQTIIRRGVIGDAERFLELCERAGKMLPVPTILINGEVAFDSVPHPDELKKAIEAALDRLK